MHRSPLTALRDSHRLLSSHRVAREVLSGTTPMTLPEIDDYARPGKRSHVLLISVGQQPDGRWLARVEATHPLRPLTKWYCTFDSQRGGLDAALKFVRECLVVPEVST